MMKPFLLSSMLLAISLMASAQPRFSQAHGLYDQESLTVELTTDDGAAEIRYTTDGCPPTAESQLYTGPLTLTQTTVLRAVEVTDGELTSPIATSTYIFVSSVLSQPALPEGYPAQWGHYSQQRGTATADYEMDPELLADTTFSQRVTEGLYSLPILSIVSDKDHFFSHENDEERGGIYIFTGPPVGDNTGHGWTRPVSVELMGGPQQHDMHADCGIRLHGGHGRLAEKNPKHSFRLVFKKEYGQGKLAYPVFGEPQEFDQLVLRCHFGYSWQHWDATQRPVAQYTRDVWARCMQQRLGGIGVKALYVHLFINGLYWGLYNIAERVDDLFGKDHLGGKKSDIDVVKIEEDGGNHIEASEGDLDAWNLMVETAEKAENNTYYYRLQGKAANGDDDPALEPLLDIDGFIDYMLINQYGGNTDWDHHNWHALRRKGTDSQGFRFLCWDTEAIFLGEDDNVLTKLNRGGFPTGIFNNLLKNPKFARRYLNRAQELLADDAPLGQQSVVELWDSLYHTIETAIYAESARWGDYRRDVHRYQSADEVFTPDVHYMTERNRLLTQYFPYRTQHVLQQIMAFVDTNADNFDIPDDWTQLTADMFQEWDGNTATSHPTGNNIDVAWRMNQNVGGGQAVAGSENLIYNQYADLTAYDKMVIFGTGKELRVVGNRLEDHGDYKQIKVTFGPDDPYWDGTMKAIVLPLADLKAVATYQGAQRSDDFLHLHVLKVERGASANVSAVYLTPSVPSSIAHAVTAHGGDNHLYNLSGQLVTRPTPGIYVRGGRKVVVR